MTEIDQASTQTLTVEAYYEGHWARATGKISKIPTTGAIGCVITMKRI